MSGNARRTAPAPEEQTAQGPDTPSAEELFCDEALARLRANDELDELVQSLRQRETRIASRLEGADTTAACRTCIDVAAADMREAGLSVPEAALADPASFFQATCELPFALSTAGIRRQAREVARVIMFASQGLLHVPASVDELHDIWEQAMLGEPRLRKTFPSSEFRTGPVAFRGPLPELELLHQCMDATEVPAWLETLIGFLSDESLPEELRAAGGLCLHDWIHPFSDGNGHTGRLLALAVLNRRYSLPTVVFFARELVLRRNVALEQFGFLRSRETDLCGFCLGVLAQMEDAQAQVLKAFG